MSICDTCARAHAGHEDHDLVLWAPPRPERRQLTPLPEPEQRAVPTNPADHKPRTIAQTFKAAEQGGWQVLCTFARGPMPDENGEQAERFHYEQGTDEHGKPKRVMVKDGPKVVNSIKLRGWKGDHNFVAVWVDGSFESAYNWKNKDVISPMSAADLAKHLKELA